MDTDCNTTPEPTRSVNFWVEVALFERFRDVAAANHRTVSQELRHVMDAHTSQADFEQKQAA